MVNLQADLINQNFICYFFLTPYFILQKSKNRLINLLINIPKNQQHKALYTDNQTIIN